MAFDSFLQLYLPPAYSDMLQGESQDKSFKNAIEISEFSFGAENTISIGSATAGGGAGKVTFKEFSIKKLTDTASSDLFLRLCNGTHYTGKINIRKAGATASSSTSTTGAPYLIFSFNLLMVKSIDWSGSSGDDVPTESVVFMFGEMQIQYQKQTGTGAMTGNYMSAWSQLQNEATFSTSPASIGT